jgi:hypothetical protein
MSLHISSNNEKKAKTVPDSRQSDQNATMLTTIEKSHFRSSDSFGEKVSGVRGGKASCAARELPGIFDIVYCLAPSKE